MRYKVVSAIFATLPRLGCLAGLRVLLAAAMALALLAFIGAPANAEEQTATSDDITAVFSFDQPQAYKWGNLHLTITRAGQVAYDAPVTARNCREPYCAPGGFDKTKSVRAQDLDGDGRPEVIVDLFWGGAHCCFLAEVFNDAGGIYGKAAERNFGDFGYRLKDLDGDRRSEFVGSDFRFDYEFSSFAFSGAPIRVYDWRQGRFRQVTRRFRAAIRADAALWMRRYRRAPRAYEPQGVLAAWAADEYRLVRRAAALRFIRREIRSGKLSTMPGRRTFVHHLDRVLRRWGY